MLAIGSLAFLAPWFLTALVILPAIWLLLRVTPPAPRQVLFPAIRLLFDLKQPEETAARTPLWLLLMRLLLVALVILGLAQPVMNPSSLTRTSGPLLIVIDDGWAGARGWALKMEAALAEVERAERDGRAVALLSTAPVAGGEAPAVIGPLRARDFRSRLQALQPKPWAVDRTAATAALERFKTDGSVQALYFADGLADPAMTGFTARLQQLGALRVATPANDDLPILLLPPENRPGEVDLTLRRADTTGPMAGAVRAIAIDGRLLAREQLRFEAGARETRVRLRLPIELRNELARLEVDGQEQAGGVVLVDDRFQRRIVGVVGSAALDATQSLLDDSFYVERALAPFAEIRRGSVAELTRANLSLLALPDSTPLGESERTALRQFIDKGGALLRFAGPRLLAGGDDLTPVRLRPGGRALGTSLQWSEPARLAPFDSASPFFGLTVPTEVTISRQLLAEPALDLAEKTWARLTDGTPLVTGERRGLGWLMLVHVPASPEWSSLSYSGLFVEMLRRVVGISRGVGEGTVGVSLPALETLDGFGRLQAGAALASALPPDASVTVTPRHPPGFYGSDVTRRALNLSASVTEISALAALPAGVERVSLGRAGDSDLRPWFLALALLIGLADIIVGLALRGLLSAPRKATATMTVLLSLIAGSAFAQQLPARLRDTTPPRNASEFALQATLETRLGYIVTGDRRQDEVSRNGLRGLSNALNRRTAIEAAEPMAVNAETDELAFFPLLYWPVVAGQATPSPKTVERLNFYLKNGGTILFDTREEASLFGPGRSSGGRQLQRLIGGLEIPPLITTPPEHVLTKAFYLLTDFPGRYVGAPLWVEAKESGLDEVSSVIVGANDYAAAWAVDENSRPMFAITPGGEQQREMALRFGINLVMYALTGNYKADQVHVNSILERLGQ